MAGLWLKRLFAALAVIALLVTASSAAALWPNSRIPQIDASGNPLVGAKAYFFDVGTTTPQTVYSDSELSIPQSSPVLADANGRFPAVYLSTNPGTYRQRVTNSAGTVIFDDDGISVPQAADYVPPDTGSTDITLLARTGDVKARYGTGTQSGWVRLNGRSIGTATSGATERANADCEDLYVFLWAQDTSLAVAGGRGVSAASDWAANKALTLPDGRERVLAGLADMGNTATTLLTGTTVDNSETTITLGATLGAGTHTLTTAEMPSHSHTFTGDALPAHAHTYGVGSSDASGGLAADGSSLSGSIPTSSVSAGTPTGTIGNTGGGGSHTIVQPTMLITFYAKL
jgi:microcystin-dependent protein